MILLILFVISGILLVLYIIQYLGSKNFKTKIENLSKRSDIARKELEALLAPSHLAETKQINNFKFKYNGLLHEIENAKKHKYFDNKIISNSNIKLLLSLLDDSENLRKKNNEIYYAIKDLTLYATQITAQYQTYTQPNHYFAYSEMEDFLKSYSSMRTKINLVFPKYAEYVTDKNAKNLPYLFVDIKKVREQHNKDFVRNELENNKDYFDKVLGKYPLDPQQRDSIVKLEDNCLVIAGAGSGKTSTIVGKAKYLVEKQHINPSKILLLTYTNKAANELKKRINFEALNCSTFHSLAYHIIAQTTGQAPSICKDDILLNVFYNLLKENKDFLQAIDNYVIDLQSLMKLEHDYTDAFSYFEDRKKYGIQAVFPDMKGNIIFTRSEEEKRLCSILTRLGVMFRYECPYPYNTQTPERRQYMPDFTIYFIDAQGQWQRIYLEHFAIDENDRVPRWFGEGTRGGWITANKKYHEGILWKRETHQQYNTTLIETTSADFRNGTVESKLKKQLSRYGVPLNEKTDAELYSIFVSRNRKIEKNVFALLKSFITLMKANEKTIDGLLKETATQNYRLTSSVEQRNRYILSEIVKPFYEAYQSELKKRHEIDFTDAIIQATQICRDGLWINYDYILVDEFQDISIDRYKFLQALRSEKPKTKLFCVGDDWQSIFRFSGSDMSLFYEFEKYFGRTETCKIETTYRFHQPLIDKSSEFIMKNPEQKKKTIKTVIGDRKRTNLNFVKCENEEDCVKSKVEEIVASLPAEDKILLIGRYNYDAKSVGFQGNIGNNDNLIKVQIAGRELSFLSVHSAKGLEADHVILVNCNQGAYGFPSLIEDDPILDFVLSKKESFPFAEERRLFYVAMTRAKKNMYVLYNQKNPSPFISEFILHFEIGSYICPKCLDGKITLIREGIAVNGTPYRSFACSNCDFFETKFGNFTPPGILITEDMTAQNVENIREKRRLAQNFIIEHNHREPEIDIDISKITF